MHRAARTPPNFPHCDGGLSEATRQPQARTGNGRERLGGRLGRLHGPSPRCASVSNEQSFVCWTDVSAASSSTPVTPQHPIQVLAPSAMSSASTTPCLRLRRVRVGSPLAVAGMARGSSSTRCVPIRLTSLACPSYVFDECRAESAQLAMHFWHIFRVGTGVVRTKYRDPASCTIRVVDASMRASFC
eukprot:SAG11_NODE_4630_length_1827_cov_1.322917_1_plen_187_part_00